MYNLKFDTSSFRALSPKSLLHSIVRHLFERIVSAYENKFVTSQNNGVYIWFTQNYGEASFPKFVDMIIQSGPLRIVL